MQCPMCTDTPLVVAMRQGIEIDYCPTCKGVWLNRGELDKIVDRSYRESVEADGARGTNTEGRAVAQRETPAGEVWTRRTKRRENLLERY